MWAWREGLVPVTEDRGARWFGTGMHLCFAEWYVPGMKRGRPLEETWDQFTKDSYETIRTQVVDDNDEHVTTYEDARELGFDMIRQYRRMYGDDPHWEVLVPEKRFAVLIPKRERLTEAIARFVGTWDLVVRDLNDGKVKIVDHKNVGTIKTKHLTIDEQKGSYISMGTFYLRQEGILGSKESIRGMEYNFLRKAKRDIRPEDELGQKLNKDGSVSKRQPTPNFLRHFEGMSPRQRNNQILRISAEVEVMNMVRSGELPVLKTPTERCPYDCDFFDLCEMHEEGVDISEYKRMAFRRRDPYFDHREGADNSKVSVTADLRTKKEATHG